jgi:hypothetical protein
MRNRLTLILIAACFGALFLTCYAPALFRDEQFAYRDASEYYYWLNKRVQDAWNAGRLPLWEPEENAGMPLLGNPTAAVFYPGKAVFAILPYAWAARTYILAHSALAWVGMLVLMRSWGTSWVGSALSAMAYAFGGPILFQYTNVIYLIGAAWLPLGLRAVDRWVRLGRLWALVELVIVLTMQILGGELQAAYLLGVASIAYAAGLVWSRRRARNDHVAGGGSSRTSSWLPVPLAAIAVVFWFVVSVAVAKWLPRLRDPAKPDLPFPWTPWVPSGVMAAWSLIALRFLLHWRGRIGRHALCVMWLGLAGAGALAATLCAAQLLPIIEFTQRTGRSRPSPDEIYKITVEPIRLIELVWPNFLGTRFQGNNNWGDAIRVPGRRPIAWVPAHYLGGLSLALALSAFSFRRGPPWRVWLGLIGALGLLGSVGQYTSPIWFCRALAVASTSTPVHNWLPDIGPLDPIDPTIARRDGFLRDSDSSVYWWMSTVLPGFGQFRYPAKLFTLTSLAVAALAGLGWDRLSAGGTRRCATWLLIFLAVTLAALAVVAWKHEPIVSSFRGLESYSYFGPLDSTGSYQAIIRSLGQAASVFALGLGLTMLARRYHALAGAMALILMTLDLAAANSRFILTVPQSVFDTKPEAVKLIEEAERKDPSPGPFRIHRMPDWHPFSWPQTRSASRMAEVAGWMRDTLDPKHGIEYGLEYTYSIGVGELERYTQFFTTFYLRVPDGRAASILGVPAGEPIVYFSRRAYDLWNTRYMIVPFDANGWREPSRSSAPFLFQANLIYPPPDSFTGPEAADRARQWAETRDFRVVRNLVEFPRAWVVHRVREAAPDSERLRDRRNRTLAEIRYNPDPVWNDASRSAYDPHQLAWISRDDLPAIRPYLSGRITGPSETVHVSYPAPEHAVLDVSLDSPGLVILADVDYPGWKLTIDGKPAPIYRANLMMRAAAVRAGRHRLEYTYDPASFKIGGVVSIAGLLVLLGLGLACLRWPTAGKVQKCGVAGIDSSVSVHR